VLKRHTKCWLVWVSIGALATLIGAAAGVASAAFLLLLDWATQIRTQHEALIYALPVAGLGIGAIYDRFGKPIRGGNNLIIDTIHASDSAQIPLRMAPMVLVGTVLTHLFGGSAGREGTAVQMGASLADAFAHRLGVSRAQLLAAGMAGGFGAVFGTPWAGMFFGIEVLTVGKIEYRAVIPALIAALVGDQVTRALGIVHTPYPHLAALSLTPRLIAKWLAFAVAVAAVTVVFIELTHGLQRVFDRHVPRLPIRMALGGVVLIGLWHVFGSRYLGLGVPTIVAAFSQPVPTFAFAWKLLFTAVTLGSGFLGGEVTPLFFIGATLGAVLAPILGIPVELGAGVGLAAVFGAAANTPLALSIMAVELMGVAILPHVLLVTVVAYVLTGRRSIYTSQRRRVSTTHDL